MDCLVRIMCKWHHWNLFFSNNEGRTVTVNRGRYMYKTTDYFCHLIEYIAVMARYFDNTCSNLPNISWKVKLFGAHYGQVASLGFFLNKVGA